MTGRKRLEMEREIGKLIVFSVVYIILIVLSIFISRSFEPFTIGSYEVNANMVCGVITAMQTFALVFVSIGLSKKGFYTVYVLLGVQFFGTLVFVLYSRALNALPGLAETLVGILVITLMRRYQITIDQKEEALVEYALTDSLTGLPNRRGMKEYFRTLHEMDDDKLEYAVVFMDLDNFKLVNDTLGHDRGDELLKQTVEVLNSVKADNDFIVRFGGDEFVIIVSKYLSEELLIDHIEEYREAVSKMIGKHHFNVSASFGIAYYGIHSKEPVRLLSYADTAMYVAKRKGKANVVVFEPYMEQVLAEDARLEALMRNAIEEKQFYMVYQPKYDAESKVIKGFEGLIRLNDEDHYPINPERMIELAEQRDLIIEMEESIMEQAFTEFQELRKENPDLVLSLNVSVIHLLHKDYMARLEEMLQKTKLPPRNFQIEVNGVLFDHPMELVEKRLNEVKSLGISLALDDFGVGVLSFSYLAKLPIDIIKIDNKYINNMFVTDNGVAQVEAMILCGHKLGYTILAEGVETEEQLQLLKEQGCDDIQGYLTGRPMSISVAKKLVASR